MLVCSLDVGHGGELLPRGLPAGRMESTPGWSGKVDTTSTIRWTVDPIPTLKGCSDLPTGRARCPGWRLDIARRDDLCRHDTQRSSVQSLDRQPRFKRLLDQFQVDSADRRRDQSRKATVPLPSSYHVHTTRRTIPGALLGKTARPHNVCTLDRHRRQSCRHLLHSGRATRYAERSMTSKAELSSLALSVPNQCTIPLSPTRTQQRTRPFKLRMRSHWWCFLPSRRR